MGVEPLFFPRLSRRGKYSKTEKGRYYADYGMYRKEIREDCLGRCVYCDIHENETGGAESMELDHFRPKKYAEFAHLINDPHNLVWACRGCNRFKGPNWPAIGTQGSKINTGEGFIDPFAENRLDYLKVLPGGKIVSIKPPGEYEIKLLVLNRVARKRMRELRLIKESWITELEMQAKESEQKIIDEPNLSANMQAFLENNANFLRDKAKVLNTLFFDFNLH